MQTPPQHVRVPRSPRRVCRVFLTRIEWALTFCHAAKERAIMSILMLDSERKRTRCALFASASPQTLSCSAGMDIIGTVCMYGSTRTTHARCAGRPRSDRLSTESRDVSISVDVIQCTYEKHSPNCIDTADGVLCSSSWIRR